MFKKLWYKIVNNRDWILIILGSFLILFSVFNLINFNPFRILQNLQKTPAVEQEGFAPLFIPGTIDDIHQIKADSEQDTVNIYIPERIVIEKINLDAPVKTAETLNATIDDQEVTQFLIPEEYAGGWHEGSASLGMIGNTVISGHHNAFGEVFANLEYLEAGDEIIMLSGANEFYYLIVNKMILPEKEEPLETRLDNARWILSSEDERLTLVTCWPDNSNSHRLILVAVPSESPKLEATPTPEGIDTFQLDRPLTEILIAGTATQTLDQEFIVRNAGRFSVNIRDLPTMDGEIVGSLKAGDEANGLGRSDNGEWIYVNYNTIKGWVSAEVVQILSTVESLPTIGLPTATP